MRILYFNYLWDIRGASLGSAVKPIELFAAMEKLGHEVKICWLKKQPEGLASTSITSAARNRLKRCLARFVHDPKLLLENFLFSAKERALVAEFQPDLIIARLDLYLFSAIRTARKFKLPIIIEADSPPVHEATSFQKQYWRVAAIPRLIERWVLRQADFVVMQSKALQEYFIGRHRLDPAKTAYVTNGADPAKFSAQEKDKVLVRKYGLANRPVLGFIGSLSVWHGIENIMSLIRSTITKFPEAHFLLVGSGGGSEKSIREFCRTHHLGKNVSLTGYVPYDRIPAHLNLMDIVLAPYPKLAFFYYSPVKIFEYMAAGKAVISTDIGQIREIITNGVDGLLCPPGNLAAIETAVEDLLRSPSTRRSLGENAAKAIANQHTWLHKAKQWEEICVKVLNESRQ